MLFVKIFLVLFSCLSFAQAGIFPSGSNVRDPSLVWNSYNETSGAFTFHFWLTNSSFSSNDVTLACPDVVIPAAFYLTNVKGMFADFRRNRLLIADWLTNIVGEVFLSDRILTSYYQLLSDGNTLEEVGSYGQFTLDELRGQLHSLAFTDDIGVDWITGNLYYARLNEFIVISPDLAYYISIKRVQRRIRALAVHPVRRTLYYSTWGSDDFSDANYRGGSSLFVTDLAGVGETTLFESPQINEVRGIAVDYDRNKFGNVNLLATVEHGDVLLYFVDVSPSSSRLLSSNFEKNSPSLTVDLEVDGATFEKLAVFDRTVYVVGSLNQNHYLWVIASGSNVMVRLPARPISIAMMVDHPGLYNSSLAHILGSCSFSSPCDRLCLPRDSADRVCKCRSGEMRDESSCNIRSGENPQPGGGAGESGEDGIGPILFVVLIPILAVLVVVVGVYVYWRIRRNKEEKSSDSSNIKNSVLTNQPGNSSDSENKDDQPQTSKENGDPQTSKDNGDPQTSKNVGDPQTSADKSNPQTSTDGKVRSRQVSESSHRSGDPRNSQISYRERDPRYERNSYRYEDDRGYGRDYYRDGRYPRDYYREGDPRSSRGYYRDGHPRYTREYYGEEDPRISRSSYREGDPRISRGPYRDGDPRIFQSSSGAVAAQHVKDPRKVKDPQPSENSVGKIKETSGEGSSKMNENVSKPSEDPTIIVKDPPRSNGDPLQVKIDVEIAEAKV